MIYLVDGFIGIDCVSHSMDKVDIVKQWLPYGKMIDKILDKMGVWDE